MKIPKLPKNFRFPQKPQKVKISVPKNSSPQNCHVPQRCYKRFPTQPRGRGFPTPVEKNGPPKSLKKSPHLPKGNTEAPREFWGKLELPQHVDPQTPPRVGNYHPRLKKCSQKVERRKPNCVLNGGIPPGCKIKPKPNVN